MVLAAVARTTQLPAAVNRGGFVAEMAFSMTSSTGNILIQDKTTVAGHLDTLFGAASSFSTQGNVAIEGNKIVNSGSVIFATPSARIQSFEIPSFSSALTVGVVDATNASNLLIGRPGNTSDVTINKAITVGGPATVHAATLNINNNFSAPGSVITLHASTAATQTSPLTADRLSLNGTGSFTLQNASNNVATLAGGTSVNPLGSVAYTDAADGLTIGQVASLTGLYSSGAINVATLSGNLSIAQLIDSALSTGDAVTLFADKPEVAEQAGDGDIIVNGSGAIGHETGARVLLYSGTKASSTGLTTLVGGEENTRVGLDATTNLSSVTPAIASTGMFALYRVTPTAPAPTPDPTPSPTPTSALKDVVLANTGSTVGGTLATIALGGILLALGAMTILRRRRVARG